MQIFHTAPEAFNLVLRLIQPSIPKTSRETIKLFGGNKSEWMDFLDNTIDRDQRTKVTAILNYFFYKLSFYVKKKTNHDFML